MSNESGTSYMPDVEAKVQEPGPSQVKTFHIFCLTNANNKQCSYATPEDALPDPADVFSPERWEQIQSILQKFEKGNATLALAMKKQNPLGGLSDD